MYEKMKDIIKIINNESPIRKQIDISNEFEETYNEDAKRLKEIEENLEVKKKVYLCTRFQKTSTGGSYRHQRKKVP